MAGRRGRRGYLILDVLGKVLGANQLATGLLGARVSLVGSSLVSHLAPESLPTLVGHLREVFASEAPRGCEVVAVLGDGARRRVRAESVAVLATEREPAHCRTVLVDLTPSPTRAAPAPRTLGQRLRTVLIVEDEPLLIRSYEECVGALGHETLTAASGKEALELLAGHQGPVDLLLTDMGLPDSNGQEVARAVRARHPTVAVVYMSALPREQLREKGLIDAAAVCMEKPFSADELGRRISAALGRGRPELRDLGI